MQKFYTAKLADKTAVRDRHTPGTPYHTRAQREIDSLAAKLAETEKEIQARISA